MCLHRLATIISSLENDAERLLEAVRGHWGLENSVHWILDVSFGEDMSRVRKGNGSENFAALRRMALNMLKREDTLKVGIAAKHKKAGWDTRYLLKVPLNKMRLPWGGGRVVRLFGNSIRLRP